MTQRSDDFQPTDGGRWHGWTFQRGSQKIFELHIGFLPNRKRKQLYVVRGGALNTLAWFRNDADARLVHDMIDRLAFGDDLDYEPWCPWEESVLE